MNTLQNLAALDLVRHLGWTLLHFLWQGAVVAILLAVALRLARRSSAAVRYALGCMALGLLLLAPVATFVALSGSSSPVETYVEAPLPEAVARA